MIQDRIPCHQGWKAVNSVTGFPIDATETGCYLMQ
jgi:hypothetical protein